MRRKSEAGATVRAASPESDFFFSEETAKLVCAMEPQSKSLEASPSEERFN
jgi:hypothetical protein